MTVFGELKIVPTTNLGDLAADVPAPAAIVNWRFGYSVRSMLIWILLFFALAAPKSNRNINALLILIPVAILHFFWLSLVKISSMNSTSFSQFSSMLYSIVISIALLWLLADKISAFSGRIVYLLALVIVIVTSFIGIFFQTAGTSEQTLLIFVITCIFSASLFSAMALTSKKSRNNFHPGRFMFWLALFMVIMGVPAMLLYYIAGSIIFSSWPSDIVSDLLQVAFIGLIAGFILYLMNLPFMILGFVNPFFRQRLYSILRLQTVPKRYLFEDDPPESEENRQP